MAIEVPYTLKDIKDRYLIAYDYEDFRQRVYDFLHDETQCPPAISGIYYRYIDSIFYGDSKRISRRELAERLDNIHITNEEKYKIKDYILYNVGAITNDQLEDACVRKMSEITEDIIDIFWESLAISEERENSYRFEELLESYEFFKNFISKIMLDMTAMQNGIRFQLEGRDKDSIDAILEKDGLLKAAENYVVAFSNTYQAPKAKDIYAMNQNRLEMLYLAAEQNGFQNKFDAAFDDAFEIYIGFPIADLKLKAQARTIEFEFPVSRFIDCVERIFHQKLGVSKLDFVMELNDIIQQAAANKQVSSPLRYSTTKLGFN